MKQLLTSKIFIICAVAVVVAAAAIVTIILVINSKSDVYRIIKVFEISGKAYVERNEVGQLDAYEGMNLESGDRLTVDKESTLRLVLDSDKYVLIEPESVLSIEATGNADSNKTTINLEQGAVVNTITQKLNESSTYEVNTPKATMAVRGTVFRVAVAKNEDGTYDTTVETVEGCVAANLLDDNDNPTGKTELINEGKKAVIKTDYEKREKEEVSFFISTDEDIDYEKFSEYAVLEIINCYSNGYTELEPVVQVLSRTYDVERITSDLEKSREDLDNGLGLPLVSESETAVNLPQSIPDVDDSKPPAETTVPNSINDEEQTVPESGLPEDEEENTKAPETQPEAEEKGKETTVPADIDDNDQSKDTNNRKTDPYNTWYKPEYTEPSNTPSTPTESQTESVVPPPFTIYFYGPDGSIITGELPYYQTNPATDDTIYSYVPPIPPETTTPTMATA